MYRTVPLNRARSVRFNIPASWHASSAGAARIAIFLLTDGVAVLAADEVTSRWLARTPQLLHNAANGPEWTLDLAILPALAAAMVVAFLTGYHRPYLSLWHGAQLMLQACLYVVGIEVVLGLVLHDIASRIPVLTALTLLSVSATALNWVARQALSWFGLSAVRVVLAGNAASFRSESIGRNYSVAARVDLRAFGPNRGFPSIRTLIAAHGAAGLLIAADTRDARANDLLRRAVIEAVPVAIALPIPAAPRLHRGLRCRFDDGRLALAFEPTWQATVARFAKGIIDIAGAAVLLVLLAPVMLLIAGAICSDGGPALFTHRRIGLDGRSFGCLKFRTMVIDAERRLQDVLASDPEAAEAWRSVHKLRNDPRVTRLGAFLRRTSLDELPQLINVLRREMSLVGPRPIEAGEASYYGDRIGYYCAVRPGITGLWQVSGRNNTTYEQRVGFDVEYVTGWCLIGDIRILLRTIPKVLLREGAV